MGSHEILALTAGWRVACQTAEGKNVASGATTHIFFHEYVVSMITESVRQENKRESDFFRGRLKEWNLMMAMQRIPEKIGASAPCGGLTRSKVFLPRHETPDGKPARVQRGTFCGLLSPQYLRQPSVSFANDLTFWHLREKAHIRTISYCT